MSNTDDIMPQLPTMDAVLVVIGLAVKLLDWAAAGAAAASEPALCRELNVRAASLRYVQAEHSGWRLPSEIGDSSDSPRSETPVKGDEPISKSGEEKC